MGKAKGMARKGKRKGKRTVNQTLFWRSIGFLYLCLVGFYLQNVGERATQRI